MPPLLPLLEYSSGVINEVDVGQSPALVEVLSQVGCPVAHHIHFWAHPKIILNVNGVRYTSIAVVDRIGVQRHVEK